MNSCKCGVRLHLEEFLFITMSIERRHFHAAKLNPHLTLHVKPCIRDQVYRITLYDPHFDNFTASLVTEPWEIVLSGSSESILPCGNIHCSRVSSSRQQKFQSRYWVVFEIGFLQDWAFCYSISVRNFSSESLRRLGAVTPRSYTADTSGVQTMDKNQYCISV